MSSNRATYSIYWFCGQKKQKPPLPIQQNRIENEYPHKWIDDEPNAFQHRNELDQHDEIRNLSKVNDNISFDGRICFNSYLNDVKYDIQL